MKSIWIVLIALLVTASASLAIASPQPPIPSTDLILSRTHTSAGDPNRPDAFRNQCNVVFLPNSIGVGVEFKRQIGQTGSYEFRPLRFTAIDEIFFHVTKAKLGPIQTRPGTPGAASLSYVAIRTYPGGSEFIDLRADGQLITRNASFSAAWLIRLIDLHCATN